MLKLWRDNTEIPWITNLDEEVFTATKGEYRLNVVRKGTNHWEWEVLFREEEILTPLPRKTDSKYRAIGMAEGLYIAHSQLYREEPTIRFMKSSIDSI